MKKTLYLKFLLAYLIFGFFGFLIISTFSSKMITDNTVRDKAEALYREAMLISSSYAEELYNNKITIDTAKTELDALDTYMSATIWLINPSGRILLDTSRPIDLETEKFVQGFNPTITAGEYYTTGTFFGSFDEEMISVLAPITSDFTVKGYVVIHYPMRQITDTANRYLNIFYITLLILFLLSMIILIFFTEIVYLPIRRITKATEEYASGNYRYPLNVESSDEIGYLAATLGYMADTLSRGEDDQRKLVANISHDFRSPLTSIKGYLEAMKDGTIPPEMYDKYLTIVIHETERLTKLTNSLLTLNNLNTEGMMLEKTDFDINLIIKNTVASFEGPCREKGIVIELVLTGETLFVNADIIKIQQVLYNLLDNAIKFSHHNSMIHIESNLKHNKVFVSVKDNGIGIPKENIKQIWDRFYKTDLSRGKDKKGTGLGLSITREIIRAHGENINVVSTEGVGTEFTFSLPPVDNDDD